MAELNVLLSRQPKCECKSDRNLNDLSRYSDIHVVFFLPFVFLFCFLKEKIVWSKIGVGREMHVNWQEKKIAIAVSMFDMTNTSDGSAWANSMHLNDG